MAGEFAGQTTLVTGGTAGIGQVVVNQLAAAGAHAGANIVADGGVTA